MKVLGEVKQKKQPEKPEGVPEKKSKTHREEQPVEVVQEKKSKKRRIEETLASNDEDIIERPKAKKKLNILQQFDDPSQKPRSHDAHKSAQINEFAMPTVTSKLKAVIPKGIDKKELKKAIKKKVLKKISEPNSSFPRPVWTSAGTFIEEPVKPYTFKLTGYKPLNPTGGSTEFRVIPFEAKAKKAAPKDSKMELLMKRNKSGRDKTMKNMKNLM